MDAACWSARAFVLGYTQKILVPPSGILITYLPLRTVQYFSYVSIAVDNGLGIALTSRVLGVY